MGWVYLSPHLDDAALSCGGLLWEYSRAGIPVLVWTIFAGDPPAGPLSPFAELLHARWQAGPRAFAARREEDREACRVLGAGLRHGTLPDCIYRVAQGEGDTPGQEHLYASEQAIFGKVDRREAGLVAALAAEIAAELPAGVEMACPLALGNHVDHQIVRAAAEQSGRDVWYYLDYPYVLAQPETVSELEAGGWQVVRMGVSEEGVRAWQAAVVAYRSQISTFWESEEAMRRAIAAYAETYRPRDGGFPAGVALLRPPGRTKLYDSQVSFTDNLH